MVEPEADKKYASHRKIAFRMGRRARAKRLLYKRPGL